MKKESRTRFAEGLVYVDDSQPGYCRRKHGRGFIYLNEEEKTLKDKKLVKRLKDLKIPPAWKNVWICKLPNGYIQATGYDDKDRKQYIYHPNWSALSLLEKFKKLYDFGKALPAIRKKIEKNLALKSWTREKVLALVLKFMDEKHIRVGNKYYKDENETFGITTLRRKHLKEEEKGALYFEFKGKSGKYRKIPIEDPELTGLIKESSELPGYEIFRYIDEEGKSRAVDSADVNEFLRQITGEQFTSKTFRTWGGTVLAVHEQKTAKKELQGDKRKSLKTTIVKKVAEKLGNTNAIAEKYYIHPSVLETISRDDYSPKAPEAKRFSKMEMKYLDDEERIVLQFLEENPETTIA